jgi:hypothetical protein
MLDNHIVNKLAITCQVTIFEVYKILDADTGRVFPSCREPKFRDDQICLAILTASIPMD